jgi:uncharacterized protein (TIGR02466 family)
MNIIGLFPEPIYKENHNFKTSILDDIKTIKFNKNHQNQISENKNILDNYTDLKVSLQKISQNFFNEIYKPSKVIELYITQSWLNLTRENQNHHLHSHKNSIISGVYYINANNNLDNIKFLNDRDFRQIYVDSDEFGTFNSQSWSFPVGTGDLVLFPSYLSHQVDNKKGDNLRVSLAFNTFIRGDLGRDDEVNRLIL